jgi:hypothetical protein
MNAWNRRIIPFTRLSPAGCAELAASARSAIDAFCAADLRVPSKGRLQAAVTRLETVAALDTYGDSPSELRETANAIMIASDFYQIAHSIHKNATDSQINREIMGAFGGLLSGDSANSSPYDLQSQYWFGMLMARAGLNPRIPRLGTRKYPDFIIDHDTLEWGVEVKRPQSERGIPRVLGDAGTQLASNKWPGVIVLDLSMCLHALLPSSGVIRSPPKAARVLTPKFTDLAKSAIRHVARYDLSTKFSRVVLGVCYARVYTWDLSDMTEPDLDMMAYMKVFPDNCAGLLVTHAERLQKALQRGFLSLKRVAEDRR